MQNLSITDLRQHCRYDYHSRNRSGHIRLGDGTGTHREYCSLPAVKLPKPNKNKIILKLIINTSSVNENAFSFPIKVRLSLIIK